MLADIMFIVILIAYLLLYFKIIVKLCDKLKIAYMKIPIFLFSIATSSVITLHMQGRL